jgi:hypothetical protein
MPSTPNNSPPKADSSPTQSSGSAISRGGKPGRSGPAKGNKNALKNGTRLNHKRLVVGELPVSMVAVKREGQGYRRVLEAEVLQLKNQINTTDAHLIDTASAATIQAGICRWLLRNKLDTMSTADIRGCTSDIVRAKERRDAAVKALQLDVEPEPIDLQTYINGSVVK